MGLTFTLCDWSGDAVPDLADRTIPLPYQSVAAINFWLCGRFGAEVSKSIAADLGQDSKAIIYPLIPLVDAHVDRMGVSSILPLI